VSRTVRRALAALAAVAFTAGTAGCATTGELNPTANDTSAFIVSRAVFEQAFPDRDPFYSYDGLVAALRTYPAFTTTGDDATRRREAAAFLADVDHETGGLKYVVEQNTANYGSYCDTTNAYYGRGPVQLSWNYNYRAAGEAIGIDLLADPAAVERDPAVAWSTGLWFWNTQVGAATATSHDAIVGGRGFGATIRSFNGVLECDGRNAGQVQNRVQAYQRFTALLDVPPGDNLSC
jgi:Chitinase class I